MKSADSRVAAIFDQTVTSLRERADGMFAWLLIAEWAAAVAVAVFISPLACAVRTSTVHVHVWAALILGGIITAFPAYLALRKPGQRMTRHLVAAAQMTMGALLIHLSGGRIETHFHV